MGRMVPAPIQETRQAVALWFPVENYVRVLKLSVLEAAIRILVSHVFLLPNLRRAMALDLVDVGAVYKRVVVNCLVEGRAIPAESPIPGVLPHLCKPTAGR